MNEGAPDKTSGSISEGNRQYFRGRWTGDRSTAKRMGGSRDNCSAALPFLSVYVLLIESWITVSA